MRISARLWTAGLVLAVAGGVGFAFWRAPDTVSIPVGTQSEALPQPMPAPPTLAAVAVQPAATPEPVPPGIGVEQWRALRAELASRPAELHRLEAYFDYADALQRFRTSPSPPLARQLDQGLDERLRQREVNGAEARQIKLAVLGVLVADDGERAASLARWEQAVQGAYPPDAADAARNAEFQRRQAEIVAAWSAQPVAQRDRRALEAELESLRRASFAAPAGPR